MIAITYMSAIYIGMYAPGWVDDTPEVDLGWGCNDDYDDACLLNQLVYRATAALLIVFGVIMLGTYGYAPMHTGLWAIKYSMVYLIWFLFLFCENHGFDKMVSSVLKCTALHCLALYCTARLYGRHDHTSLPFYATSIHPRVLPCPAMSANRSRFLPPGQHHAVYVVLLAVRPVAARD